MESQNQWSHIHNLNVNTICKLISFHPNNHTTLKKIALWLHIEFMDHNQCHFHELHDGVCCALI